MSDPDPEGPINRREFEQAFAGLTTAIAKIEKKIEEKAPGLGNMLTLGAMAVAVIVTFVQSSSRLNALDSWAQTHQQFSDAKSNEFAKGISELHATVEANKVALQEQATQNQWAADTQNMMDQLLDMRAQAAAKGVALSEIRYWPLGHIGKAGYEQH